MTAAAAKRDLLLLALLALLLFAPGIASRELWNPDEPRYAEVAREMLRGGDWFVPHLNDDVYTQKPPLLFWLIAAVGALRGDVDAVAARIPSLLAAIAAVLATYRLAADVAGRRTGWIAALLFASCSKILWQARVGQIDMLLIALVAWAFWCWTRAEREGRPGWALLGFALAGLGTVAKGPVSLLPILLGWLVFALWERSAAGLKRLRIGFGFLVYLAVVLAWLVPAALAGGGEYIQQIAFRQTVTRYADPWHHFQPWYYYLTVLPVDFFPASLLLPAGLIAGFRGLQGEERRAFRLYLAWAVATLVFFSLSPAKRTVYILTLYPGLSAALALGLGAVERRFPRERAWQAVPFAVVALLFIVAALAVPLSLATRPEVQMVGAQAIPRATILATLAAALSLWAFFEARRNRILRALAGWTAALGVFAVGASLFLLPLLDPVKSPRDLAHTYRRLAQPGEPYSIYPRFDANVLFHVERPATVVNDEAELRQFLAVDRKAWLFAKRDALAKLEGLPPLHQVASDPDAEAGYLLLTTRP